MLNNTNIPQLESFVLQPFFLETNILLMHILHQHFENQICDVPLRHDTDPSLNTDSILIQSALSFKTGFNSD